MKKRVAKSTVEEKVLTKKDRIISSLIFGIGFSGFAIPGIYSLTVGSLNAGTSFLHIVLMYFLCSLGIIVATPLFFLFGYFGKPSKRYLKDDVRKKYVTFFDNPGYCGLKGNKYKH